MDFVSAESRYLTCLDSRLFTSLETVKSNTEVLLSCWKLRAQHFISLVCGPGSKVQNPNCCCDRLLDGAEPHVTACLTYAFASLGRTAYVNNSLRPGPPKPLIEEIKLETHLSLRITDAARQPGEAPEMSLSGQLSDRGRNVAIPGCFKFLNSLKRI